MCLRSGGGPVGHPDGCGSDDPRLLHPPHDGSQRVRHRHQRGRGGRRGLLYPCTTNIAWLRSQTNYF